MATDRRPRAPGSGVASFTAPASPVAAVALAVSVLAGSVLVSACGPRPADRGRVPDDGGGSATGSTAGAPADAPPDTLLAVNGTRLFVHREGAGPAMIVVHGGPLLDHGYLVEPLRPLAEGHELVFFDQRLSGRSAGVVDSASMRLDTLVADIEGVRSELGLGRVDLVGHSWGGLLALLYAVQHPDRLRSLVLLDPMPPAAELWREEQRAQAAALELADTAGMGALRASDAVRAGDPAAVEALLRLSFRSQLADPAMADRLEFHIEPDYRERSRQFGYLMPDLVSYDLRPTLPELRVPTLVVYGAAEVGAAAGRSALEAIPEVTVEVIPDAGHFPFLERPESFLRAVRAFLDRVGE